MAERGINHIIFDLSQTYYIDSTGIGVFIYCFDIAKKQTVKMCLCNVFGTVYQIKPIFYYGWHIRGWDRFGKRLNH